MQRYLDDEVTPSEKAEFLIHLENCTSCKELWHEAKSEKDEVNFFISLIRDENESTQIPPFNRVRRRSFTVRLTIYASLAAVILLLIGIYFSRNDLDSSPEIVYNSGLEIERYIYDSDLNQTWNEKQSLTIITDSEGNTTFLQN